MNNDNLVTSVNNQQEITEAKSINQDELAEITNTIANDLEAPLRSLAMFTELLTEEYQDELDHQGQQYLDQIAHSSSRMQTLIEDLSIYSQIGTGEQTWITVDLNQIVEQIKLDLQSAIASSKVKITTKDLPQLLINPQEIYQLLHNLIDNAIKYGGAATPQIQVTATVRQQSWLIAVTDNGIGIAPEFQSRIFEIFQRLDNVAACPGSGIGLAICQKIVKGYGGKIWLESKADQGSTFYFTLPLNTPPQLPTPKIV